MLTPRYRRDPEILEIAEDLIAELNVDIKQISERIRRSAERSRLFLDALQWTRKREKKAEQGLPKIRDKLRDCGLDLVVAHVELEIAKVRDIRKRGKQGGAVKGKARRFRSKVTVEEHLAAALIHEILQARVPGGRKRGLGYKGAVLLHYLGYLSDIPEVRAGDPAILAVAEQGKTDLGLHRCC